VSTGVYPRALNKSSCVNSCGLSNLLVELAHVPGKLSAEEPILELISTMNFGE
jgi:hypothetical protein